MTSTGITPQTITPTFTPAVASSVTYVTFLPGNAGLISGTGAGGRSRAGRRLAWLPG